MIETDDRGFTLGDGLFETVLWANGTLHLWDLHVDRLNRGCRVLGLPAPEAGRLETAARAALTSANLMETRAAVRLSWTAGRGGRGLDRPAELVPQLAVQASPTARPQSPARLIVSSVRRNEGSPISRLKSLSYLDPVLARRDARSRGADEAIMLNNRDELACASAANLVWRVGERLFTPDLACGVLDGALLTALRRAGVAITPTFAPLSVLEKIDGLWLSNALIGLRPVARLEDRDLPLPGLPLAVATVLAQICPA